MLNAFLALLERTDEERFNALFRTYGDLVYCRAYQILKDVRLSEDAVQETFCTLAKHMKCIEGRSDLAARNYLLVICRNESLRLCKKHKREIPTAFWDIDMQDELDVECEIEAKDTLRHVFRLILSLDPKYRDVLYLRYYFRLKDHEIAEQLGIRYETVKVRLSRGKRMLKQKMTEEGLYDG